jgi:hypothetical protein
VCLQCLPGPSYTDGHEKIHQLGPDSYNALSFDPPSSTSPRPQSIVTMWSNPWLIGLWKFHLSDDPKEPLVIITARHLLLAFFQLGILHVFFEPQGYIFYHGQESHQSRSRTGRRSCQRQYHNARPTTICLWQTAESRKQREASTIANGPEDVCLDCCIPDNVLC